ncbi:MAG: hypothetical protein RIT81_37955 [Deltaproteobacteria bacterium]
MKIPDSNWLGRLQRATQSEGPHGVAPARQEDLVKAGDDIFSKAAAYAQQAGGSPLDIGARLWEARARGGIPGLAERIASGEVEDASQYLQGSTIEEVQKLVDELAVRMLATEGREGELSQLLDLKSVADAGANLIPQYNRRIRSQLTHQGRPPQIDPQFAKTFAAIEQRIGDHYVQQQTDRGVDVLRDAAVAGSKKMWTTGLDLLGRLKDAATGESAVGGWVKDAVSRVKDVVRSALPEGVLVRLEEAAKGAQTVVDAIDGIADVGDDREVAARFSAALPSVKETFDSKSDAIAVGMLKEGAAVVTGSSGHEIVYLRDKGELQINELSGVGLRLGIGGTARAFTRNAYGDVDAEKKSVRRTGAEVGAVCAHLGTYKSGGGGPKGWHSTFSLGYNLSIPLLSDQSLFDIKSEPVRTVKLAPEEVARIESQLSSVSSGAAKWHDQMRSATGA